MKTKTVLFLLSLLLFFSAVFPFFPVIDIRLDCGPVLAGEEAPEEPVCPDTHYVEAVMPYPGMVRGEIRSVLSSRKGSEGYFVYVLPVNTIYGEEYLKINGVKVTGRKSSYETGDGILEILVEEPEDKAEIAIDFTLEIPVAPRRFGIWKDTVRLTNWLPVPAPYREGEGWKIFSFSDFGDPFYYEAAYFSGKINYPSGYEIASPFVYRTEDESGAKTSYFNSRTLVRDLSAVMVSGYCRNVTERQWGTLDFYSPGPSGGKEEMHAEAMGYFNDIYGDYGLSRYVVVELELADFYGSEFSGLSLIDTGIGNDPVTCSHEASHQFWYRKVGSNQLDEPWVDESLAVYSSALFMEKKYGAAAYEDAASRLFQAHDDWKKKPLGDYATKEEYKTEAYRKSAMFRHNIREEKGLRYLTEFLKYIQGEYNNKIITWDQVERELSGWR